MKSKLSKSHAELKRTRGRGTDLQSSAAALLYLRRLESELGMIQQLLVGARGAAEHGRDWRKFLRHSDNAQQQLHRAIKRLKRVAK